MTREQVAEAMAAAAAETRQRARFAGGPGYRGMDIGVPESDLEILAELVTIQHEVLEKIAKGEGRFSIIPLTHASNTIEDMIALTVEPLALMPTKEDTHDDSQR